MKFNIEIVVVLILNFILLCNTCELSGEICVCNKYDSFTTTIICLEKFTNEKLLNLSEVNIRSNPTYLIIQLENKIYNGIISSDKTISLRILKLTLINNQIANY